MKELKIDALTQNLDKVIAFLEEELEAMNCPMKIMLQIDVAVEEIYVNIASYAYTSGVGYAIIQVEGSKNPDMVSITFIDEGIPYNPLEKDDPDVTLAAEERQIGGLGIYMVKKSMDSMEYERKDEKNILTITKSF